MQVVRPAEPPDRPVVLARGKPFSFDSLDVTLPLDKLLYRLHASVDRASHFQLRLDHHLPVLLSPRASEERRIVAAYLCHRPYRAATAEAACHPFRAVLYALSARSSELPAALSHVVEVLLHGSEREVDELGAESPQQLVRSQSSTPGPSTGVSSRIAELVRKATTQTLSMGEQRTLGAALGRSIPGVEESLDELAPVWLAPLIEPYDLILSAANNPMATCEMAGKICQEAIYSIENRDGDDGGEPAFARISAQRYLAELQDLPPTLRSFDLVTRLLRSERPAPATLEHRTLSVLTTKQKRIYLTSTVSHLARSFVLGGFLANSVRHLERRESDEESAILAEAHDAGLPEPSRRDVEDMLEDRMSREVSIFCHFIRSLISAALLYTPDLGALRRQIAELRHEMDAEQIQEVENQVEAMEAELESGTQAMLIELQHFALHFGRYRDGTRLYGELSSLA